MPETTTRDFRHWARGQPWFFWFVALTGVFTLGIFAFNLFITYHYGHWDKFGYELENRGNWVYVAEVDPAGPAAGKLAPGDQVLALTDVSGMVPMVWYRTLKQKLHLSPPGTPYSLHIRRLREEKIVDLQLALFRLTDASERLRGITSAFLSSFPFAVVALLIGLLKPRDHNARWAFAAMICFSLNYLYSGAADVTAHLLDVVWLKIVLLQFILSGATLFIALSYNLYYRFPAGKPPSRFWAAINWLLLAWGGAIYLAGILRVSLVYFGFPLTTALFSLFRTTRLANDAYIVSGLLATCAVCLHNYRRITETDGRNRIKLMIFGSLLAFIPNILLYLIRFLSLGFGWNNIKIRQATDYLNVIAEFSPLIIAVAWAYAILKHRVLEVDLVLRRGLQYLLAKNVLRIILALPLLALIYSAVTNPNRTLKELFFAQPFNLLLITLAALSLKFRQQLRDWVDRRFFRSAYSREQLLYSLLEQIKGFKTAPGMSYFVGQQLTAALHPSRLYVYYRAPERDELVLGYATGGTLAETPLPVTLGLLREMESKTGALDWPSPMFNELPTTAQRWLEKLQVRLIVPIRSTEERLLGMLLLGEKLSEQPYNAPDRGFLHGIARQMAVVAENLSLKEQVNQELKIKHQVLAHLSSDGINLVKECPNCGLCYDSAVGYCRDCGHTLTLSLPIERTLDGKYRLERLIGKGGMGAVYEATDLRLQRQVALKVITGELFGNREALSRFEREARLSARLNHPNIVALHDYGRAGAEGAYLVMEFLRGRSLRQEMGEEKGLPTAVIADWFGQILEGVGAAHHAGIIHRDLKPENVFLAAQPDGQMLVKLLDFGIAKLRQLDNAETLGITTPGMLVGTPNYMAPELLAGGAASDRGDIFALGVMLVEMLTGQRPFQGSTYHEMVQAIIQQTYHLPGGSEVATLDRIIQKCLAKNPARRYATVTEFQAEVLPALLGRQPSNNSSEALRITQTLTPKP
jgi:hypothetical protein